MKKISIFILASLFLVGCSGNGGTGDDTSVVTPEENKAPSIPSLISPSNNLLCTDSTLEFKWNVSSDPNGDNVKYKIEVSKDNLFTSIAQTATVSATSKTLTLEKGVAYYWRVEAIDEKNESSGFSSIFNLYTEGEGTTNHLPFSPQLVKPELNSNVESGSTILEWSGSDTDGDQLSYDIYFDENNPPTSLISENQSESSININASSKATYYWRIIVKDDKGGETIGQIWTFNTD